MPYLKGQEVFGYSQLIVENRGQCWLIFSFLGKAKNPDLYVTFSYLVPCGPKQTNKTKTKNPQYLCMLQLLAQGMHTHACMLKTKIMKVFSNLSTMNRWAIKGILSLSDYLQPDPTSQVSSGISRIPSMKEFANKSHLYKSLEDKRE